MNFFHENYYMKNDADFFRDTLDPWLNSRIFFSGWPPSRPLFFLKINQNFSAFFLAEKIPYNCHVAVVFKAPWSASQPA